MVNTRNEVKFKIVVVGDTNVGKSCILRRYGYSEFPSCIKSTVGVDFILKEIFKKNINFKLQIWDTAGQERFRTIIAGYYRGADVVIFVFDKSNRKSFENIEEWVREVTQYLNENTFKVLVGNKSDMMCTVDDSEGTDKGNRLGMKYFGVSAKTGDGVICVFDFITEAVLSKSGGKGEIEGIKLGSDRVCNKSWCCY